MTKLFEALNNAVGEIQKKVDQTKSAEQIDAETNRVNELLKNGKLNTNALSLDTNPGASYVSKISTGDEFYDMTIQKSYLLSQLFAQGYKGTNLTNEFIVKVIDTNIKLFKLANDQGKPGVINKAGNKVKIKQCQMGGTIDIDFSMFIGGRPREAVLIDIADKMLSGGAVTSIEDTLINGDVRNTTANVNGLSAPLTGDLPSFLAFDGLRKYALDGYQLYDAGTESVTFTAYSSPEKAAIKKDFGATFTLAQFIAFSGMLKCANNRKLFIMNTDTFAKLEVLAAATPGSMKEIVDGAGFFEAGSLYRFMGRTIYVTDVVGKVLATGYTDPVAANNVKDYMICVDMGCVVWGFGTEIASGNEGQYGADSIWTRFAIGAGVVTTPADPRVVIAVNI